MTTENKDVDGSVTPPVVDRGDDFMPTEPAVAEPKVEAPAITPDPAIAPDPAVTPDPAIAPDPAVTPDPAPQRDDKGRFIPKHRFDLRTQQLRQLETEHRRVLEENATLKSADKGTPPPTVTDLDTQLAAIDEKIFEARKDGDLDAERKLLTEARKIQQAHFEGQLAAARTQASSAAVESMTLDSAIDEIEAAHPFLDPSSKEFDKERADELVELWEAYELRGYSKADALLKATALLLPEAADRAPDPTPDPEKPAPRKTDIKKNLDAAKKTPPNLSDVGGLDSDKGGIRDVITPSKLSEKDFEALPDSVRAKLRGDYV